MSDLVTDVINLDHVHTPVNERIYSKFAGQVRNALLDLYYAGIKTPLKLLGTSSQIAAFMKTLQGEKRYMDSYMANGLNDSRTLSSKHDLTRSVANFEKETGLRWPFKN